MKGFFRWFKSSTRIKRWMFLILLGIISFCYAISNIITAESLDFSGLIKILISFVFGFVASIVGIVYIQKRTLEMLVENTDSRKKVDVKSLLFDKKVYNQGPKIVVLGAGSGLNNILRGLKYYTDNITAIVPISDSTSEYSESSQVFDGLPLHEVKESIISLAKDEEKMRNILNHRFSTEGLKSISFGDIFLLALNENERNFAKSIETTKDILNMTGKVLTVTLEEMKVCAELEDGTTIEGKENIPEAVNSRACKINRIYLNPYNCKPSIGVIESIMEADAVVIAPGSLYTDIVPNLLIRGVTKAIRDSNAFKIYVSNLMTEPGQTYNYTLSDHINVINAHAGGNIIDYCIYDTSEITPEYLRKYNMNGYELVEQDIQKVKNLGIKVMQRQISSIQGEYIRHDSRLVAQSIIELVCDDLKFKDKQNDTKYMLLNDRLKSSKKHNQKIERNKRKSAKKRVNGKSKFYSKYQERIASIQESDMKLKEKERLNKIKEKARNKEKEKIEKLEEKLRAKRNLSEIKNKKIEDLKSKKIELQEEIVKKESEKSKRKVDKQEPKITKRNSKVKTNIDDDNYSMPNQNKIDQLDDINRKQIIDTINKLRR